MRAEKTLFLALGLCLALLASPAANSATADFNLDGKSDILWRHTNGTNYVWHVNGALINGGVLSIPSQGLLPGVDTSWVVAGVGDFNGDGKADILWRHTDGTNYVWHLDGSSITGGVLTIVSQGLLPAVDSTWTVAGIGDFNGDGKSDILWRKSNGTNYVWHVNGASISGGVLAIASQGLLPGVDTSWNVVGIGDFNGDGKSDILWRRNDGTNYVWHVNGSSIIGGVLGISSQGLLPAAHTSWSVAGIGDFNGGGKSDILWRRSDGVNYVWHVDGNSIIGGILGISSQGLLPGVTDLGWRVAQVGDYNGDGKSDVLWRHTNGTNYVWHLNGSSIIGGMLAITSQGLLPGVDTSWGVSSGSVTLTLAWDAVTDPSLGGYRIYYGTAPGTYLQPLGQGPDVGNVTTYTVTGLSRGKRYYFAATAVDTSNNESVFSNEVFKDIP